MLAVIFALSASVFWGAGDLLAGLSSRRVSAWSVSLGVQASGLIAGLLVLVSLGRSWIGWTALVPSLVAGLLLALGTVAFFRAMAIGPMSVVAPIGGACAVVPVAVGLAQGENPSVLQAVGAVAAVIGVMLASHERAHPGAVVGTIELGVSRSPEGMERGEEGGGFVPGAAGPAQRPSVKQGGGLEAGRTGLAYLLAVLAALGFGLTLVGFAETAAHDPFWPAVGARMVSVPVLGMFVLWRTFRSARRPEGEAGQGSGPDASPAPSVGVGPGEGRPRFVVPAVAVAGVLYLAAATLYSVATTRGLLSLVAVLSSLAAVLTVSFAHVFLRERLAPSQRVGVALAILGVLAIAGG